MVVDVCLVKNIDILGSESFFESAKNVISKLKDRTLPIEESIQGVFKKHRTFNVRFHNEASGIITIELKEPRNGIKAGLFRILDDIDSQEPVLQRFKLTADKNGASVLGLTFSMRHPDFEKILKNEIENLIGEI